MGRIKPLIADRYPKLIYCGIPDCVEDGTNKLHLGVFSGQSSPELHKRTAGQIIFIIVHVERIPPAHVKAERVQGFLVAQVVPLL